MTKAKFLQKIILGIVILVLSVGFIVNVNIPFSLLTFIGVVFVIIGWFYFSFKMEHLTNKITFLLVFVIFVFMVFGQILVLKYLPSSVYHDPFRVYYQAEQLALNHRNWSDTSYFWRYPNNTMIVILLSWLLKFSHLFNISTQLTIYILSLLCFDGFILSIIYMARKKSNVIQIGIVLFFALLPLSYTYMIKVFYTDSVALLCVTWIIYLILNWTEYSKRRCYFNGVFLIFFTVIGQLVKPNIIIILIAVILWALFNFICHREIFKKRILVPTIFLIIGFGISVPVKQMILNSANYQQNSKYELPTNSWIYMGLNKKQHGAYAGSDVKDLLKLKNKDTRQIVIKRRIFKRLKTYSFIDFLKHSFIKMGILLSSKPVLTSYTGGHTSAPNFCQQHQAILSQVIELIQRILWGSLYMLALLSTIQSCKNIKLNSWKEYKIGFVNLTFLGYVALHTLIWETEARYSLVLIPLLFYIIWYNNEKLINSCNLGKIKFKKIFLKLLFLFIGVLGITLLFGQYKNEKVVTIAQRSQLSKQYNAKTTSLFPKQILKQKVCIGTKIDNLTLQVPQGSKVNVSLINLNDKKKYRLRYINTSKGSFMANKHPLKAGNYEFEIKNNTDKVQKVWIVTLNDYHLAQYSIKSSQFIPTGSSFIYTFYEQQKTIQL